ncbi:hypothetical protein EHO57_13725 [Leptospira langatensis]|uniref:Uncharacterized protein n=1 Tax=Leptospira langatensis TaxID=2484983 RepID=A0A5R2ASN3_9LEPT|nr:hypothetical protein [Leptospira langatensis]TGJ99818.1 hypothetical protein EHO57_13725 [Leptospira langatensis]
MIKDISADFKYNPKDAYYAKKLLKYEGKPEAILYLDSIAGNLSDYAYWFCLSTQWVSYTGWSELETWKRLFDSTRPSKQTSLMKPSELCVLARFANEISIYRAHRPGETDWIAYTINPEVALRFCQERGADEYAEYIVRKEDITALFLRRKEFEIIVTDRSKANFVRNHRIDL